MRAFKCCSTEDMESSNQRAHGMLIQNDMPGAVSLENCADSELKQDRIGCGACLGKAAATCRWSIAI